MATDLDKSSGAAEGEGIVEGQRDTLGESLTRTNESTEKSVTSEISFADIMNSQDQTEKVNEALLQIEGGEEYNNEQLISLKGIIDNAIKKLRWHRRLKENEKLSGEAEGTIERIYRASNSIERALFPMYSEIHERAMQYNEKTLSYGEISSEERKLLVGSNFMYQLFRNHYPKDHVPTEEEIGESMLSDDEYRKIGPVFMAHHMVASLKTNGPLPSDAVIIHVTEAFWKDGPGKNKRITDWSRDYFRDISSRALKWKNNRERSNML